MNTVYAYDVDVKIVPRHGPIRAGDILTRREHAYSVMDALMQATIGQAGDSPNCDVTVVKIGPASEVVEAATTDLAAEIESGMKRIRGDAK